MRICSHRPPSRACLNNGRWFLNKLKWLKIDMFVKLFLIAFFGHASSAPTRTFVYDDGGTDWGLCVLSIARQSRQPVSHIDDDHGLAYSSGRAQPPHRVQFFKSNWPLCLEPRRRWIFSRVPHMTWSIMSTATEAAAYWRQRQSRAPPINPLTSSVLQEANSHIKTRKGINY